MKPFDLKRVLIFILAGIALMRSNFIPLNTLFIYPFILNSSKNLFVVAIIFEIYLAQWVVIARVAYIQNPFIPSAFFNCRTNTRCVTNISLYSNIHFSITISKVHFGFCNNFGITFSDPILLEKSIQNISRYHSTTYLKSFIWCIG